MNERVEMLLELMQRLNDDLKMYKKWYSEERELRKAAEKRVAELKSELDRVRAAEETVNSFVEGE